LPNENQFHTLQQKQIETKSNKGHGNSNFKPQTQRPMKLLIVRMKGPAYK